MKKTLYIKYKEFGELYSELHTNNNANLLVILPWQTLPACMFFDLPIYEDGSSIKDELLKNGYDVLFLDPVWYGSSHWMVFPLYTRKHVAEQVVWAIEIYRKNYSKVFLEGFCSTSHVPLIVAEMAKIDGIVLIWPITLDTERSLHQTKKHLKEKRHNLSIEFQYLSIDFEEFIVKRFLEGSDSRIKNHARIPHWKEKFLKKLSEIENFKSLWEKKWYWPRDMANDMYLFKAIYKNEWWNPQNIHCPIFMMRGEFDVECTEEWIERFIALAWKNNCTKKVIPWSTHYWMWEKNFKLWTSSLIEWLNQINQS